MRHSLKDIALKKNQRLISQNNLYQKREEIPNEIITLSETHYETQNSIFGVDKDQYMYQFDQSTNAPIKRDGANSDLLMQIQFYRSPKQIKIKKITYGIEHLMCDFGGFIISSEKITRILVKPIAEYFFFMIMLTRLYFAKTVRDDIFD